MGLTFVQKSDPNVKKKRPKIALVLSGGAVSGGAYKIGGLKALNDFLINRKITDFDTYVGLSAGSILSAPLSGGIPPEEMLRSLDGSSENFSQLRFSDFYNPNFREFVLKPTKLLFDIYTFLPQMAYDILTSWEYFSGRTRRSVKNFTKAPSISTFEDLFRPVIDVILEREFPSLLDYLPSGFFDNKSIEKYMRHNIESNRMSNDFREMYRRTGKELYIVATNLDTADREVFGHDENDSLSISEAIQASTALPGFYKPARLNGADYIDGGVRKTANIDVAVEHGADLIICYNPFRPIVNKSDLHYSTRLGRYIETGKRVSDRGVLNIINQVFRTLLWTRLQMTMKHYASDPNFKGDIILIEPDEEDLNFFELNPINFWSIAKAAEHGFNSVIDSISREYPRVKGILSNYGIDMSRRYAEDRSEKLKQYQYDEEAIMDILQEQRPLFKVVG